MEFLNNVTDVANNEAITQYVSSILSHFGIFAPMIGICLPIIESFFPILPLVAIVTVNVSIFGFFWGYIYSWIGNCIGSFLLFLIIRKIGGKKLEDKIKKSKYASFLEKIKNKNSSFLFFLYCFPFTPSFLISGASALANMKTREFLSSLIPAKLIMMILLSFIGVNVGSFFQKPIKSGIFILLIILFNLVCKKLLEKYEEKHRKD